MTEKRSDYRKKLKRQRGKKVLNSIKSAFDDSDEEVDVNPEFTRDADEVVHTNEQVNAETSEKKRNSPNRESKSQSPTSQEKALKLKGKLNRAILIVAVLIILVLFALFHL